MARMKRCYVEANGRHIYKTYEEYKGVKWICKGSSKESDSLAKESWKKNREKKIAEIEGAIQVKTGRVRLSSAIREWYNLYKRSESIKGRPRSAATVRTDEDTLNQIISDIGELYVCDISSEVIQKSLSRLQQRGVSQSIINKRWNMFNMYFAYVYPDGNNPMSKCKKPSSKKWDRLWLTEDDSVHKKSYTAEQMRMLAEEFQRPYVQKSHWKTHESGYSCGELLTVIMYEFLRIAESTELRVKDVDFDKSVIHVRRQYQEKEKKTVLPKYGSRRTVPIMKECLSILEHACIGKGPDDLLFDAFQIYGSRTSEHEGHIIQGRIRENLYYACERLGLEQHTVHDLRHDGISRLVNMGVKPQSVSRWAGHKSVAFTMDKYYRHTGVEDADDLALVVGK